MYILLALLGGIGYSLQGSLMSHYYRTMDRLSASAYRGLSLGISMAPLLIFVPAENYQILLSYVPLLTFACVITAFGNWSMASAYAYIPIGIVSASLVTLSTLSITLIRWFGFGETLSVQQLIFAATLVTLVSLLGISRASENGEHSYDYKRGVFFAAIAAVINAFAVICVGEISMVIHPFLTGYIWEFGIGIAALFIGILRRATGKRSGIQPIPFQDFKKILIFSSPTAFATACYATALTMGPMAIAASVISLQIIFACIFGYMFYNEKLTKIQLALICTVFLAVAGFKVI